MTRNALPVYRRQWSEDSSLGPDHPTQEKHAKYRVSRGKHHLLVSLQLKLGLGRSCTLITVQCLGLLLLLTGALLLAQGELYRAASGSKPLDAEQHRLLLATHNRLAWYYPYQDAIKVLLEGEGVHYGMFPGEPLPQHPRTVWNVIRPHNWRPATEKEYLVLLDADTGEELRHAQIPSRFTHDAVRIGDSVYVCSTGNGTILELSYPNMTLVRSMPLFTDKDHPNTLAGVPGDSDHIWVLLHNLGESDLVKVFVGPGGQPAHEVSRITGVGSKAHGAVAWGSDLIMLDSDSGALVSLDTRTGDVFDLYMVPEEGKFLKGLAVLDDIAYFGITTWAERSVRDSPDNHGELGAFDLINNKLLWRRTVATSGLLNIIGAPHLAVDSTYAATYSRTDTADLMRSALPTPLPAPPSSNVVMPDSEAVVQAAVDVLRAAGHPPKPIDPADYWSSGWPRLNPAPKLTESPEDAGLQLPLFHANITALQAKVLALPNAAWTHDHQALHNAVMNGRTQNMEKFKPGVEGIVLIFSDNEGDKVYEFPYYTLLKAELEPLLLEILGPTDVNNIVRLQLARMAPGTSDIKTHQDMGGYAMHGHRIHVPLTTHPLVSFSQCPDGDGNAAALLQGLAAAAAEGAAAGSGVARRKLAATELLQEVSATPLEAAAQAHAAEAVEGTWAGTERQTLAGSSQQGVAQQHRQLLAAEPQPSTFAVQQQWVAAQQEQAQASGQQQMPRPLELLPVESVGGYYTGYVGHTADEADETSGAATYQHSSQHRQHQHHQSPGHVPSQPAVAPATAAVPSPPELQPVDPRDAYYGGAAVQDASQHQPHQAPKPHPIPKQHPHQQQRRRQQQLELLKQRGQRPCLKLLTPEGLVFELNNRVPHKVSNPAASHTTRIHLVIDVFESPRARTPLQPGSSCEYGAMPVNALRNLQDMIERQHTALEDVKQEIRALVASPGMTCVGPDGRRVMPLRKARLSAAEAAEVQQEEEMVQDLLAQLQGLAGAGNKSEAASAALDSLQ